ARLAPHVIDVGTDAITIAENFAWQQFVAPHDRFAASEVHDHVAVFDPLDDTVDDVAATVLVLAVLPITLGLPPLLHTDFLCGLRGGAASFERRQRICNSFTNLRGCMALARLLQCDLV